MLAFVRAYAPVLEAVGPRLNPDPSARKDDRLQRRRREAGIALCTGARLCALRFGPGRRLRRLRGMSCRAQARGRHPLEHRPQGHVGAVRQWLSVVHITRCLIAPSTMELVLKWVTVLVECVVKLQKFLRALHLVSFVLACFVALALAGVALVSEVSMIAFSVWTSVGCHRSEEV